DLVVAQGELLKRHEQLNHDYVDLRNHNDAHLLELDHLRLSVRRTEQENEGLNNKLSLIESVHFGCASREKELTNVDLEPKTYQLETAEERIRVLEGEKRALSVELAWSKKVTDSYLLPMADLLQVSLDVPAPRPTADVPGSTGEQADDIDPRLPPPHHEIIEDTPFRTTT
nr:hypothetical protein [Tanacetum cinerariifolium]